MKQNLPSVCAVVSILSASCACAANLMFDFGQTAAADPYLTLSPAHSSGRIAMDQTVWNTISSSSANSSLAYSDGTSAAGVVLTMGQETTGGNNVINFSTTITSTALVGTGGATAGKVALLRAGSIYGDDSSSTAPARDGFFGSGTATSTGSAIGLRVDGLTAGSYLIYVMGRNTNTNANDLPMNIHLGMGASSGTFDFSGAGSQSIANTSYATATYVDEYNRFIEGGNYVAFSVAIGAGQSVFLASDGTAAGEKRGFLNMIQIVQVPEPALSLMGLCGALPLLRRRR